ncbi:hypothetical protein GpartN1_g1748.t1 [Galdieria partita]|uniref:Calcineurin-like phosphoesterase domain-containing protein n=1 Tax=Galdieria partita TaxID=83374 RepID=A0A9C7PUQ1_9RHOD|nr:hypothetical protein GpartN1_g1748.t1 [Galdieria partita]
MNDILRLMFIVIGTKSHIHYHATRKLFSNTAEPFLDRSYKVKYKRYRRLFTYATCNQAPISPTLQEESDLPKHLKVQKLSPVPEIESFDQFVIFSDLHLRKDNVETCIQVLKRVHQVAHERNAGVVFLGDFWDRRGSLPVEPLNAAMEELQRWRQPLILIPGNHDQVSYDGTVHSLLPIRVSLKHSVALLMDQPSIFMGALWIPFIRESRLLTKVISSIASPLWSQLEAVFCHTDIQGAQWVAQTESHSSFHCTQGVAPDCFPSHVEVYSGHFHKPQQIPNTHIRYVGSPFQVSVMESGQQKYLFVVSRSHRWAVQEAIPISLGPKYYDYHWNDILRNVSLDCIQPGDRVFLRVNSDIPESQIAPVLKQLRQQKKASVFTFVEPDKESSVSRVEADNSFPSEWRDPNRILQQYGEVYKLSLPVMNVGKEIIQQVLASQEHTWVDYQRSNSIDLCLDGIYIDGFGSFRDAVTYPLSNRGLVIVTGENKDDMTSTSNGSGKTTLLMATLWCLNASMACCVHSDVIHDDRKEAQVTVYGRCNGRRLQVTRYIQRKRSSHRLRIWLDGEECTCQEIRATQERLDRWIDTRLLSHCVFFGQHILDDLFASSDREWKEQLSRLTPLDTWEDCKQYVRNRLKALDEDILRLRSQMEATEKGCKQLESRIEMHQMEYERWLSSQAVNRQNSLLHSCRLDEQSNAWGDDDVHRANRQWDIRDVLQRWNDRWKDIQHHIQLTKQRWLHLQQGITTLQQQIANHRNKYKFIQCIEEQWVEWQQQYIQWKRQRDDKRQQIFHILQHKPTLLQCNEQLQRLQLQWDKCQDELNVKSQQLTQWEEMAVGKQTIDENGSSPIEKAYSRWKRWKLRYKRYQLEYNKVWNEKVALQTKWDEASKVENEEEWIMCDHCLQRVSPIHYKRALERLLHSSIQREQAMATRLNHIQRHREQAKQAYQQLVYDSIAKVQQEINDIQMAKERIMEERNNVQQQVIQLKQLVQECRQLDEEQSWKNQLVILLDQMNEKKEASDEMPTTSQLEKESTYDVFHCDDLSDLVTKTLQQKKVMYEQELNNQMKEYQHLEEEYEEQKQLLEEWNNKALECWKEKSECEARIEYLQKERDLLEREAILHSHNPFVSLLKREREDWEQHNRQLATWREELRRLENDQQVLQQLDKVFGPRGIPNFVLKQVLYELQQRINYYLSVISHGYIQVELRPFTCLKSKREQMVEMIDKKILIKNCHGSFSNRSYLQLSGGQRRRLGVALALAFHDIGERRCGFHCNMMVLDEIFQHLDSEGKKRVADILEKLGKESIFVVVHDMDEAMNHLPCAFHDIVMKQDDVSSVWVDKKSQ